MVGIHVIKSGEPPGYIVDSMDAVTQTWTLFAARGESSWICSDCCSCFPEGMPNECIHGIQACTDIIKQNKAESGVKE